MALRPVVPITVEGMAPPQLCLLDSGSLRNRFASYLARAAGVDLTGAEEEVLGIGGIRTTARTVPVRLTLGDTTWEAPVSFCEPWPWAFQLLGQEGFFRWFEVALRASQYTIDVEPEDG